MSKLENLRKQCKVKGDYKIGLLRHRHILMKFNLIEDLINMLSKTDYYNTVKDKVMYQMRLLIYDAKFK